MSVLSGSISQVLSKPARTMCNDACTLQIYSIKKIAAADGASTRYRLELSDGQALCQAMIATQLNVLIENSEAKESSIVTMNQYMINEANGTKILVIMQMSVVSVESKILLDANAVPPYVAAAVPIQTNAPPMVPMKAPISPGAVPTFGYGGSSSYGNAANIRPVVTATSHANTIPIAALNPYSNKWSVKARITSKSDKRSWNNSKGSGTLFSIDLLDSEKGEIRATFFKETCEKYHPILREGSVYVFSDGKLKPVTNRQYSTLANNYEITFDNNSTIEEVADEGNISAMNYNFVSIESLSTMEPGGTVDLIAYVQEASECQEIISKNQGGKVLQKRDLTIMDQSGAEIKLTLWGAKAESADYPWYDKPICAFKSVKLGDYGGRSLSMMGSSALVIAPQLPEAEALKSWCIEQMQGGGSIKATTSLSNSGGGAGGLRDAFENRKPCAAIKNEAMGIGKDKADWASMKLSVVYIKHDNDPWYTACSTGDCKKKVIEDMNGKWRCEKCECEMDNCRRRYILTTQLCDTSGANWFSFFDEQAQSLLGMSADDLFALRSEQGEDAYNQVFSDAMFKTYIIKSRIKEEDINGESRVKCTVSNLDKINYAKECSDMLDAINKYE